MDTDSRNEQSWLTTISLFTVALVAVGFALAFARSVLIPFVMAIFIALLVAPVLDFQVLKMKLPRPLAVATTLILVTVILAVFFVIVGGAIQTIIATAGRYTDSFISLLDNSIAKARDWGLEIDRVRLVEGIKSRVLMAAQETVGIMLSFLSTLLFVAIFVVFLLIGRRPTVVHSKIYNNINLKLRRYVTIRVGVSLVTGVLVWAILEAFDMELAGVFGLLAFFLNFIPSIGSVIATVLPLPIAVAQFQNPWMIVGILVVPGVVQMTMGNILEPRIMGEGLDLHPVAVLLALSFWGLLWGLVGMLLAVPITAVISIVCMQFGTLRPVGRLLAGELPRLEK